MKKRLISVTLCLILVMTMITGTAAAATGDQKNLAGLYVLAFDADLKEFLEESLSEGIDYTVTTSDCWGDDMGRVYIDSNNLTITLCGLAVQSKYTFRDYNNQYAFLLATFYTILSLDEGDVHDKDVKVYINDDYGRSSPVSAETLSRMADQIRDELGL